MTNAEQIALYWKQVEAIEEERASLDDKADAIRAKIRALEPPPPPPEPGSLDDYYARIVAPKMQEIAENAFNALLDMPHIYDDFKIGEPLRIRLPNDYTVRNTHG